MKIFEQYILSFNGEVLDLENSKKVVTSLNRIRDLVLNYYPVHAKVFSQYKMNFETFLNNVVKSFSIVKFNEEYVHEMKREASYESKFENLKDLIKVFQNPMDQDRFEEYLWEFYLEDVFDRELLDVLFINLWETDFSNYEEDNDPENVFPKQINLLLFEFITKPVYQNDGLRKRALADLRFLNDLNNLLKSKICIGDNPDEHQEFLNYLSVVEAQDVKDDLKALFCNRVGIHDIGLFSGVSSLIEKYRKEFEKDTND